MDSLMIPNKRTLSQADIDGIETFVFFIGWQRSCHSIIGSMLDAHPNVVIAHEYFLFRKLSKNKQLFGNRSLLFDKIYKNSYSSFITGMRNANEDLKGYNLNIADSWQGRFTKIKVIGDKAGGNTIKMYMESRQRFRVLYQKLRETVKVPIKVVNIIRNPYDMVATQTLLHGAGIRVHTTNSTAAHKYTNNNVLREQIDTLLKHSHALNTMIHEIGLSPLQVHCEELIAHPAETISNICQFLNLDCSTQYLQMCAEKTFKNVSATHNLVEWDTSGLELLNRKIMEFPFFQQYRL